MQVVLNGHSCGQMAHLGKDLVWTIIERLESYGWKRVSTVGNIVCLERNP